MPAQPVLIRGPLIVLWLAAAAALSGCAVARLVPSPEATLVPGEGRTAVIEAAGVRVTAEANAWTGTPSNLAAEVTPLKVSIENHSNEPLRIRYNDFSLATDLGYRYAALPPYQIRGSIPAFGDQARFEPHFSWSGFYVAPYYSPYFASLPPWNYPWAFDGFYYRRYYPMWHLQLPTRDMRERAIPEGVLEPKGSVSGFLYFPKLSGRASHVTFVAGLMDGKTGDGFGEISIPFELR